MEVHNLIRVSLFLVKAALRGVERRGETKRVKGSFKLDQSKIVLNKPWDNTGSRSAPRETDSSQR